LFPFINSALIAIVLLRKRVATGGWRWFHQSY
jgi:hypothetical protein